MATADHTIHVSARTYELLHKEAERRHLDIDATADDIAELDRTFDRAARLRATLPRTDDAVSLIREGREELNRRTQLR
jgi:hypothetical protein